MHSASDLRRAIERFLAMGGGSFALLPDLVDEVQPLKSPTTASSQAPEERSLTQEAVMKADSDKGSS